MQKAGIRFRELRCVFSPISAQAMERQAVRKRQIDRETVMERSRSRNTADNIEFREKARKLQIQIDLGQLDGCTEAPDGPSHRKELE